MLAESVGLSDGQGGEEGGVKLEPWREQVPLLSGSVRFGGKESGLGGRLIEVRVVVGRWCRFVGMEGGHEGA